MVGGAILAKYSHVRGCVTAMHAAALVTDLLACKQWLRCLMNDVGEGERKGVCTSLLGGGGSVVCCCREECSEEHGIVLTPNFVNCIMKVSK